LEVARSLAAKGALLQHGFQARLAQKLGVSRATICRDVKAIVQEGHPCPLCGAYYKPPKLGSIFDV
jgi:hypothetical protein